MSMLSDNEKVTRQASQDIGNLVGIDPQIVRLILDGLSYYVLHKIAEVGKEHRESGTKKKFKVQIPMIGEVVFTPRKYHDTAHIQVSVLEGKALVTSFNVREPFLQKARMAYYTGEDYLLENAENQFNKFIIDNYSRIISSEGDE